MPNPITAVKKMPNVMLLLILLMEFPIVAQWSQRKIAEADQMLELLHDTYSLLLLHVTRHVPLTLPLLSSHLPGQVFGVVVEHSPALLQVRPLVPVVFAFTKPEKIVILKTATAATTLRFTKERRVRPLVMGSCFMGIGGG